MTADKRAGTRNAYYRERRQKQKAALEAAKPPDGGKLTETILVRVSQRAVFEVDKARRGGLFERSRSEFMRDALDHYLRSFQ